MAKRTTKSRRAKPKRMARKRRDWSFPVWIVACVLVVLAGGLAVWVWRPGDPVLVPPEILEVEWQAGPGDVVAFADSAAIRTRKTLIQLGIPPNVISLKRVPDDPSSQMRWEVESEVPEGLPMSVCNLALTKLANRLGGDVISGRENLQGTQLSLLLGLAGERTDLITLRANPNLARVVGRIAIVVDDFGYQDRALIEGFCALQQPVTLSIFPHEELSRWIAEKAATHGHRVMVHLPMEPIDYPARDPGPDAIFEDYSYERIQQITRDALDMVPHAVGMNNHMGSRVTEDRTVMGAVLREVKDQGFFFIDSVTSPNSVAYEVAQEMQVPSGRNTLFLDRNEETEAVEKLLFALAAWSRQEGTVIGIGHAKRNTLTAFQRVLPELEKQGFVFIGADEAVR